MKKYLLDTNILLDFILKRSPQRVKKIRTFLTENYVDSQFFVSIVIIAEIIWVLKSFYKRSRTETVSILEKILKTNQIKICECESENVIEKTLNNYKKYNISFVDAYLGALYSTGNYKSVVTFDNDFNKIPGIKRVAL